MNRLFQDEVNVGQDLIFRLIGKVQEEQRDNA